MEQVQVELTERAALAAQRLQAETPAYQGLHLRLYLDGKGCDGFVYGVCFDHTGDQDYRVEQWGTLLLVDHDTAEFVAGATIDWVDDERGQGFWVENPMHKRYRGKFFKRKAWQERLEAKKQAASIAQREKVGGADQAFGD